MFFQNLNEEVISMSVNKIVLVTGGASGLGRVIVEEFLKNN